MLLKQITLIAMPPLHMLEPRVKARPDPIPSRRPHTYQAGALRRAPPVLVVDTYKLDTTALCS